MMTRYEIWRLGIDIATILLSGAAFLYARHIKQQAVTANRIKSVEDAVAGHDSRLTTVEADLRHLPGHQDINKLSARIEDLHADLHEVVGGLNGLRRAVDLMNEYLINRGGKD